MKKNKMLEKEFEKDGVKINWIEMGSGARQAQALASNSAQVATAMNFSSLLLANTNGNKIQIVSGVARPSELFALVCTKGKTPKDSNDTVVGGPKGTALHQLFADYMNSKKEQKVEPKFIHMTQNAALSALLTEKIDCALLAGALLEKAKQNGAKEVANAKNFTGVNLGLVVKKEFAEKYPEAVRKIVDVQEKAFELIKNNPKDTIEQGAHELGIPIEQAENLAKKYGYYQKLSTGDIKQLELTQRFLKNYGFIGRTVPIGELVLPLAKE